MRSAPLRATAVMLCGALALCASAQAGTGLASKPSGVVRYQAIVTSNPQAGGCYGAVGVHVGLQGQVKTRIPQAKLGQLARRNMPSRAQMKAGGKTYALRLDRASSVYGNKQIGWTFHVVRMPKQAALKLIGQKAQLRYVIRGMVRKARSRIVDGRCKSLI